MSTWSASLIFIDKINNRENKIKFTFPPLYTYNTLYRNLEKIYKTIGWGVLNYSKEYITFKMVTFIGEPVKIINWTDYIINKDRIHIIIHNPKPTYYALYTELGEKVIQTTKIKAIYDDIKIDHITERLLLYRVNKNGSKIKLIDVIDSSERIYNQLINRMISRKWY